MSRRRFLILTNPVAAEDLPRLLGRLTLDYTAPLDNSAPDDPSPIAKLHLQGIVTEKAATVFAKAKKNSDLKLALEPIFSFSGSNESSNETSLKSSRIETHRLKDHYKVFQEISEHHATEIKELLDTTAPRIGIVPEKVFMVIGYKSIVNAKRITKTTQAHKDNVDASIPAGAIANVAAPGSLPLDAEVKGSGGSSGDGELNTDSVVVGTTGFAVEYRTFKRSKVLAFLRKKSVTGGYTMRDVKTFPAGQAMSKGDDDDDDDDDDSDSGDGSDPLTLELEYHNAEHYELCEMGVEEYWVPKKQKETVENEEDGGTEVAEEATDTPSKDDNAPKDADSR